MARRLPERALTQLLSDLKTDMEAKANYLKYLKISAKFISPCNCKSRMVHSYCITDNCGVGGLDLRAREVHAFCEGRAVAAGLWA